MEQAAAEANRIVDEHFKAEGSMNIDAIMATYTDDIEFDVGGMPETLRGKQAAAGFYKQLFSDLLTDKVTPLRRLVSPTFVIDDAIYECRAVGRPFGIEGKGRPVKFRLMHIFEIRDGRISRENAWLDVGAIQQQLA
ncbi:nuclear transport factor 2 family protein [Hyalangium versicolor]|uniref:nuclear transport factor 2 family protein n=1 Tax=Hyalangium versicolor TaxID=2861190 RepID=UPI001CC9485C|nr:nuclear transport factor 2 family protein [Hyalangium versicolor]